MRGRSSSEHGVGIEGIAEANGPSVIAYGVHGVTHATATNDSAGVEGDATGAAVGVLGKSVGDFAAGVYGIGNTATPQGSTVGVEGDTNSVGSFGVIGASLNSTSGAGGVGVNGSAADDSGFGVKGVAQSTVGVTTGVFGRSKSPDGIGVRASNIATTGNGTALMAISNSASGPAFVANNTAGGKLISAQNAGTEKFSVDGSGTVIASNVKLGTAQSNAVGADENLRIVRGTVDALGNILAGSGFVVMHSASTGIYQINFSTQFNAAAPSVVVNPYSTVTATFASVTSSLSDHFIVQTGDNNGTPHEEGFSFIAIGPR